MDIYKILPMYIPQFSFSQPQMELDSTSSLNWERWLNLISEEMAYFPEHQGNSLLLISQLRKIFYDGWGWDEYLIRGAKSIPNRYDVRIFSHSEDPLDQGKERQIIYSAQDKKYPERAGQCPELVRADHQELLCPDQYKVDLGHVLAGLDAQNHPQCISPLPQRIFALAPYFPNVKSNVDLVTWLGDLASLTADYAIHRFKGQELSTADKQKLCEHHIPNADTLGNIDAYVIGFFYKTLVQSSAQGDPARILRHYYQNPQSPRCARFQIFARLIGLQYTEKGWANQKAWLDHYKPQLLVNTLFQVYSLGAEKWQSITLPLALYLGLYRQDLELEAVLIGFIDELHRACQLETPPSWIQGSLYAPYYTA